MNTSIQATTKKTEKTRGKRRNARQQRIRFAPIRFRNSWLTQRPNGILVWFVLFVGVTARRRAKRIWMIKMIHCHGATAKVFSVDQLLFGYQSLWIVDVIIGLRWGAVKSDWEVMRIGVKVKTVPVDYWFVVAKWLWATKMRSGFFFRRKLQRLIIYALAHHWLVNEFYSIGNSCNGWPVRSFTKPVIPLAWVCNITT